MNHHTARVRSRVLTTISAALLLTFVLAAPAAGLPAATSPARLPRSAGSGSGAPFATTLPELPITGFVPHASGGFTAATVVTPSDVAVPFDGGYYWTDTFLNADGWVTNDTAADVGPIWVHYVVQTTGGVTVKDEVGAVAVYNLKPGESATFKNIFDLPAYAGATMNVYVETLAVQPAQATDAVDLTYVSQSVETNPSGQRKWTFTYRNDSSLILENPVLGGWELDTDSNVVGTLLGASRDRLAPGQTCALETYGLSTAAPVVSVDTYCQAVPAPPVQLDPVFRFYNASKGTHFYTLSAEERDMVISRWPHVFTYEGVAYHTNAATNQQPLYRFYYNRGGTHFYTASDEEAALVLNRWPSIFTFEGVAYRVSAAAPSGGTTVYRFINRKNSSHFYTASAEEADMVRTRWSRTYIYEGPAFWIAP